MKKGSEMDNDTKRQICNPRSNSGRVDCTHFYTYPYGRYKYIFLPPQVCVCVCQIAGQIRFASRGWQPNLGEEQR